MSKAMQSFNDRVIMLKLKSFFLLLFLFSTNEASSQDTLTRLIGSWNCLQENQLTEKILYKNDFSITYYEDKKVAVQVGYITTSSIDSPEIKSVLKYRADLLIWREGGQYSSQPQTIEAKIIENEFKFLTPDFVSGFEKYKPVYTGNTAFVAEDEVEMIPNDGNPVIKCKRTKN